MLNRSKLVNSPIVYDEITHQLEEYLKVKKPNETIKLKNESLNFVKGKSYVDFFRTFLNEKSNSSDPIIVDTFNINTKNNNIYFGKLALPIDSLETYEANKSAILDTLSNMRYYMNAVSFRKDDESFNRDFLEFVINNKLINHSFNSSTNNDRIFNPNDSTGKPFNKAIQFHILNSTPRLLSEEEKEESKFDDKLDRIQKRLGEYNNLEALVNAFNNLNDSQKELYRDFFTNRKEDLKQKIRENLSNKNSIEELTESFNKLNTEQKAIYRKYFTERRKTLQATTSNSDSLDELANNLINKFNPIEQPITNTTEVKPEWNNAFEDSSLPGSFADTLSKALNPDFEQAEPNNEYQEENEPDESQFSNFVLDTSIETPIEVNTTNDYVESLSHDDELQIKTNKAILNGRINRLSNKLDSGTISKDKIKQSFNEYNANTYEKFIEMLNILYSDNSSELNKFITFANKVFDKDSNTNIFNC